MKSKWQKFSKDFWTKVSVDGNVMNPGLEIGKIKDCPWKTDRKTGYYVAVGDIESDYSVGIYEYIDDASVLEEFSTKSAAIKFAKNYMRTH